MKRTHHTTSALEALDVDGEKYDLFGDERATPVFLKRIDEGYGVKAHLKIYYTVEIYLDPLGVLQYAVVIRKPPNLTAACC
jgi:hypothetical protein